MSLRNTEVVRAMGMTEGLLKRWGRDRNRMLERQVTASDRAATMQSVIRFLRLSMRSLILGLGAYLVIERLATVGAMFAAIVLIACCCACGMAPEFATRSANGCTSGARF